MEDKKKRSTNFAPREINLFMNCLIPALKIIENKQSDGASLKEKKDAWKRVYTKFIAPNDQVRDLQCLKLKYDNIKRNLKKKISQNKIEIKKTGGGPPEEAKLTWYEEQLYSLLHLSIDGLVPQGDCDTPINEFDCEASTSTAVCSDTVFEEQNFNFEIPVIFNSWKKPFFENDLEKKDMPVELQSIVLDGGILKIFAVFLSKPKKKIYIQKKPQKRQAGT